MLGDSQLFAPTFLPKVSTPPNCDECQVNCCEAGFYEGNI